MSIKGRLIKSGVASSIQKIVRILEQLFLIPFFLSSWGAVYYGDWITLSAIPSVLSLTDLGFGTAASNQFALQYLSGRRQDAANTYMTGLSVISFVVVLGIVFSVCATYLIDFLGGFSGLVIDEKTAVFSVSCLMASRLIVFFNQIFGAHYRVSGRTYLAINFATVITVFRMLGTVLVLSLGFGLKAIAALDLIITCLSTPLYCAVGYRQTKIFREYKGVVSFSEIRRIAVNGFGYLLSPMWQVLIFQGTTLIVRIILGPVSVTVFTTVRILTRSITQLFSIVSMSALPELQLAIGRGDGSVARRLYRVVFVGSVLLSVFGAIALIAVGPYIYGLWTQGKVELPQSVWLVMILSVIGYSVWWSTTVVFQAANKPYRMAVPTLVASCCSLVFCIVLCQFWGLLGVSLGILFMDVGLVVFLLPNACSLLGQKMNSLLRDCFVDSVGYLKGVRRKIFL